MAAVPISLTTRSSYPRAGAQGFLGADTQWDASLGGWRIVKVRDGSAWDISGSSPLAAAGVAAQEGEAVVAINHRRSCSTASRFWQVQQITSVHG